MGLGRVAKHGSFHKWLHEVAASLWHICYNHGIMTQSDLHSTSNTTTEDARTLHPAYAGLVKESAPHTPVWLGANKRILTAREMQTAVEAHSPDGFAFAEAVLAQAMKFVCEKHRHLLKRSLLRQVDVTPRMHFIATFEAMAPDCIVWTTMSRKFTAGDMAQLLRDRDPDGLQYASDLLRVARDVVSRRSLLNA
jgi:hypothetical protein